MLCISLNVFEDIFNLKNHFFNSKIFSITRCYWHIFNKCKILFVICLYFWCFWTVVLEKTLKSPLDCKEIKSVNHKGYQSWIFIGKTDAEAEIPILWPPDGKNWLIGKVSQFPDAGKDWRQEEKGTTDDEMIGWHHWLDGHGSEQTWGVGDGQGSLECCSPWGRRESDMIEQMNWNELVYTPILI